MLHGTGRSGIGGAPPSPKSRLSKRDAPLLPGRPLERATGRLTLHRTKFRTSDSIHPGGDANATLLNRTFMLYVSRLKWTGINNRTSIKMYVLLEV